ncbi:MAG: DUF1294 domain-containing protein [Oscillospiraceae bacterium]|nr:DUF1294 domain-containing protein [Oscillospiraceae bacterium]
MRGIYLYLIVINVVAFFAFGLDKLKAKADAWRIPEKTLLGLAVIGGSVGAILGMRTFRHKTRHKQFSVGMPLILAVQIVIVVLLLRG